MAAQLSTPTIRGRFVDHEPMSRHCSWRTGGPAEHFFEPADVDDLAEFLRDTDADAELTWIGLGSNLLIRDGGLAGTVISTSKHLTNWRWLDDGGLFAECGVPCAKVAKESVRAGRRGAEFMAGIPGAVGGALAMNAGAHESDIWSIVERVTMMDRGGRLHELESSAFDVGYRRVDCPEHQWFVGAVFRLPDDVEAVGEAQIRAYLAHRNETQPTRQSSCGSVFKNPPGDYAGRLIEQAGLKGARVGGCHVSEKHANFIINDSNASAQDIEKLIDLIRRTVATKHGVNLDSEVRILGIPDHRGSQQ